MWQRFTERARKVVFYAQEEAGNRGDNNVNVVHMLLGLLREDDSVAALILLGMNVNLMSLRRSAEAAAPFNYSGKAGQDRQLTVGGKRLIDFAYHAATELGNNYIGTEHLLLGILRLDTEPKAAQILRAAGVTLDPALTAIRHFQEAAKATSTMPVMTAAANTVIERARLIAARSTTMDTSPHHLMAAVLTVPSGAARRLIDRLGVDVSAVDGTADPIEGEPPPLSSMAVDTCRLAESFAKSRFGENRVSTDLLLVALANGHCQSELTSMGLAWEPILETMLKMRDEES